MQQVQKPELGQDPALEAQKKGNTMTPVAHGNPIWPIWATFWLGVLVIAAGAVYGLRMNTSGTWDADCSTQRHLHRQGESTTKERAMTRTDQSIDTDTGERPLDTYTGESLWEVEGFHINSIDALNWLLCKRGDLEAAAERQKLVAKAAKERAESLQKQADQLLYAFKGEIEPFVRRLLEDPAVNPGKRRSVILAGGEVGFRRTQGHVEVHEEDEAKVIRWCKEHLPAAVRPHDELLLIPLKEALQAGEELPPGITWREPEEKLWTR